MSSANNKRIKNANPKQGHLCLQVSVRLVGVLLSLSNPRQYSHWFNLNISTPSCEQLLRAIMQTTYAVDL